MSVQTEDGVLPAAGDGDREVLPGECVASIALAAGFAAETVWNHKGNAGLRDARTTPYVLQAGDRITLPPKEAGGRVCVTGKQHVFRRVGVPEKLRVALSDAAGPRAHLHYVLTIDGVKLDGITGADGMIEEWIPPNARRGEILLKLKDRQPWEAKEEIYPLDIGGLDPAGSESGARARLVNLGLLAALDSVHYGEALASLQRLHGLDVTGTLDTATQTQLLQLHGY